MYFKYTFISIFIYLIDNATLTATYKYISYIYKIISNEKLDVGLIQTCIESQPLNM